MNEYAPVLVTGFNRPKFLEDRIEKLLELKCQVYISLDVPRLDDNPNRKHSRACINIVEAYSKDLAGVRISNQSLGCFKGITEGISWAFSQIDALIIVEDDVRVDEEFLSFASKMLIKFESNKTIGSVAGSNFVPQAELTHTGRQFRFSAYSSSWGWATWKDRWSDYLLDIETFPTIKFDFPEDFWVWRRKHFWNKVFRDTQNGVYDAWDYRWLYSNWKRGRLTLVSNANLVANLGFGELATHTKNQEPPWWLPEKIESVQEALEFPELVLRDLGADRWMEDYHFQMKTSQQLRAIASRRFPKIIGSYRNTLGKLL